MIVLAVDPGGTTGWAKLNVDEKAVASGEPVRKCVAELAYGQIPILGGGGTSSEIGSFSATAAEERVARLLYDLAVGPHPDRWMWDGNGRAIDESGRTSFGGDEAVFRMEADAVVFEDFTLREKTMGRSLLLPVRMTSAFRGMAWLGAPGLLEDAIVLDGGAVPRWTIQSPSDGKTVVTNERLKRWKFWVKGMEHSRDAIRHGLLWIMKHQSKF